MAFRINITVTRRKMDLTALANQLASIIEGFTGKRTYININKVVRDDVKVGDRR